MREGEGRVCGDEENPEETGGGKKKGGVTSRQRRKKRNFATTRWSGIWGNESPPKSGRSKNQ